MRPLNLLMRPLSNDSKISTNTCRNCHQGTNIHNGVCTFLPSLIVTFLLPYDLGVFKFVCLTEISRRDAKNVIAVGISSVDALILSVLIVISWATRVGNVRTLHDVALLILESSCHKLLVFMVFFGLLPLRSILLLLLPVKTLQLLN